MPGYDYEAVDSIPNTAENALVDYQGIIDKLKDASDSTDKVAIRKVEPKDADAIVRSFKKLGGVKVNTRRNAESLTHRDVYVTLYPWAEEPKPRGGLVAGPGRNAVDPADK